MSYFIFLPFNQITKLRPKRTKIASRGPPALKLLRWKVVENNAWKERQSTATLHFLYLRSLAHSLKGQISSMPMSKPVLSALFGNSLQSLCICTMRQFCLGTIRKKSISHLQFLKNSQLRKETRPKAVQIVGNEKPCGEKEKSCPMLSIIFNSACKNELSKLPFCTNLFCRSLLVNLKEQNWAT